MGDTTLCDPCVSFPVSPAVIRVTLNCSHFPLHLGAKQMASAPLSPACPLHWSSRKKEVLCDCS